MLKVTIVFRNVTEDIKRRVRHGFLSVDEAETAAWHGTALTYSTGGTAVEQHLALEEAGLLLGVEVLCVTVAKNDV